MHGDKLLKKKAGQITYLPGKLSSFNSLFSIQISCDPVIQLNINFQYCKSVCTITHDVSNNSLPANISNLFLYSTQVHSFNSRFFETGSLNIKSNQIRFPTFIDFSIRHLPARESLQATCSASPVNKHFILS